MLPAPASRGSSVGCQYEQLVGITSSPKPDMSTPSSGRGRAVASSYNEGAVFSPPGLGQNELSPITSDHSVNSPPQSRVADIFNASLVSSGGFVNIDDNPLCHSSSEHLNVTSQALFKCKQKVLKPYLRLISVLGWHPIISDHSYKLWARILNALYPFLIMAIIVLGYIIQWALCFKRLPKQFDTKHFLANHTPAAGNDTDPCHTGLFSNYIVPDLLHGAAFLYSFYVIRWNENEHLVTLMERVFLQTSSAHSGWLSQPRLIRRLRFLLVFNVLWVLFSIVAHVLRVLALTLGVEHKYDVHFKLFHVSETSRYVLLVLLLAGLAAMDVVYASVMTNYAIQCQLLITHMRCTMLRTRQKIVTLPQAMKDISEERRYLRTLNDKVATAVSMLLFNLAALFIVRLYELFTFPPLSIFVAANAMRSIVLLVLLTLPIVQACRVTNSGYALQKLGHEIAVRPFGYQDTPVEEIHSFQLFASTLQPRAKLFRVPIHASWVFSICVSLCFLLLVALQVELIEISF